MPLPRRRLIRPTIVPVSPDPQRQRRTQKLRERLAHERAALARWQKRLKRAFNADVDGLAGLQELAGDATMLFYATEEAHEGSQAFLEKRRPDFSRFPRRP